jgi:hypothetical protein
MSRTRALLIALSACLALATPAHAARYEVVACGDDGINASWALSHDGVGGYTTGGVACPGGSGRDRGIFVRNTGHPTAGAPGLTAATATISAPPGTAIVGLRGRVDLNATLGWKAGIYDFYGRRWLSCGPGCLSTFNLWPAFAIDGISSLQVGGLLICGASSCGRSGSPAAGSIAVSHVVATLEDTWKPSLSLTGGALRRPGWHRQSQDLTWAATDNTGIRSFRVLLDGAPFGTYERSCDPHLLIPCQNGGERLTLDTAAFTKRDGPHSVRVEAYDAGGNVATATEGFYVDNNAPAQPLAVSLAGGATWRASNSFSLSWRNPSQNASPIAGVNYKLCPASRPPGDEKGCVGGARNGAGIRLLTGLRVPTSGDWTLRLWLRDQAGNQDPYRSFTVPGLRFDDVPPTLVFAPPVADDPTLVKVRAADVGSGLARTEILLRRVGTSNWISLATARTSGGFAARVDDEHLGNGTYELRARAVDAAGNERSTMARGNGSLARIVLPLRIKTRLRVGKVKRFGVRDARGKRRIRRIWIVKPRAHFGHTIRLRGRLTSPGGNPLVDSEVEVWQQLRLPDAQRVRIASLRTSRTGRFTFKALRGPSRVLFFRYPGTRTIRARTTAVDLRIQASSSFHVSARAVRNGQAVTFRGRVRGRPLPAEGKLVELQVFTRGQWRTFAQPRASARTGRWAYPYRFEAIQGHARFQFRARIRKELGFPYDLGYSRQRSVTVSGL